MHLLPTMIDARNASIMVGAEFGGLWLVSSGACEQGG